jgi:hypothetical protein
MSKILVIQPHKMLQQALVVALFPEHHVRVMERIPGAVVDADLVIIDAAALRERNSLTEREIRALDNCNLPIVWIDAEAPGEPERKSRLLHLMPPLKRDDLKAVVADCLRSLPVQESADRAANRSVPANTRQAEPKPDGFAGDGNKEIIELLDVFEEIPARDGGESEARNKN